MTDDRDDELSPEEILHQLYQLMEVGLEEINGNLLGGLKAHAKAFHEISKAIRILSEQVEVLREVNDELREELSHANRNHGGELLRSEHVPPTDNEPNRQTASAKDSFVTAKQTTQGAPQAPQRLF